MSQVEIQDNVGNQVLGQVDKELPIIPMSKVCLELVTKLKTQPSQQFILPAATSIEDAAYIYYREYQKLFSENQGLNDQLIEVITRRNQLADQYNLMKKLNNSEELVKRKRRYAREVQRLFHCPIEKCRKGYGSEGSLAHHVRLKHMDFYLSGKFEVFIQNYIEKITPQKSKNQSESKKKPVKVQLQSIKEERTLSSPNQ